MRRLHWGSEILAGLMGFSRRYHWTQSSESLSFSQWIYAELIYPLRGCLLLDAQLLQIEIPSQDLSNELLRCSLRRSTQQHCQWFCCHDRLTLTFVMYLCNTLCCIGAWYFVVIKRKSSTKILRAKLWIFLAFGRKRITRIWKLCYSTWKIWVSVLCVGLKIYWKNRTLHQQLFMWNVL